MGAKVASLRPGTGHKTRFIRLIGEPGCKAGTAIRSGSRKGLTWKRTLCAWPKSSRRGTGIAASVEDARSIPCSYHVEIPARQTEPEKIWRWLSGLKRKQRSVETENEAEEEQGMGRGV